MKRFAPGVLPTVLVLALLALLISLGLWQLGRGEEKRLMLARYAERRAEQPVPIDQLLTSAGPAYRRVQLRGQFDAQHSLLLDNITRDGQVGVELIQPFQDQDSGAWALVNRGWVAWPDRRVAPVFNTPTQSVSLHAWVYMLPVTFQLQPDSADAPWPRVITAVEPGKLWAELGREGFAQELRMESGLGAYRLDWPIVTMGPEKHLGYAVQWFAMAAALFALYLYLGWHQAKNENNNKTTPEAPNGRDHQSRWHV